VEFKEMIEKSYRFKIASGLTAILFSALVMLGLNDLGCVNRQFNGAGEVTTLATFYLPQTGGVASNLSVTGLSMSSGIDMNGNSIENLSSDFANNMVTLYSPCTNVTAETDITIEVESGKPIYNISVLGDSDISFDLSSIDITNNVARWETWIKVFAPGMTVGLPSTNAVQYLEIPDLTTTTANELMQISWQAWMDGTNSMMQGHLYNRNTQMPPPTLAELRTYHYGSPTIEESPDAWFGFDPGTGTITNFNYAAGREDVVIPWEIGGVAVEAIGDQAFAPNYMGHPIETVIGPKTVLSIGNNVFSFCASLTSVSLPAATSIGNNAFYGCTSLTSVSLPAATSIGEYAFDSCSSLTSISLPAATSIGDYAFENCTSLTSVSLPAATSIGYNAFSYCSSLTSVSLPAATSIGNNAFDSCSSLTSIYFGTAKPSEGYDIFYSDGDPINVTIYYPTGASAWSGVTTWGGKPTSTYTPPAP
jgi:hypothetical protein